MVPLPYLLNDYHHPLFGTQLSQSPALESPPSHYSGNEAKFDVQVRVQHSFSFEELQSGSHFGFLDESDPQFYQVDGQLVLIPDEADDSFLVHGTYPTADLVHKSGLHLEYLTMESYALQNPLGNNPIPSQSICSTPQLTTPSHDWQFVKQEPVEGVTTYANPALPAIARHLYTLPDHDDDSLASPSKMLMQYVDNWKSLISISMYDEPPMDSFSPPANSGSLPCFQILPPPQVTQDDVVLGSLLFTHEASFQMNFGQDEWEDNMLTGAPRLTVPSQSYMFSEFPLPASFSQSLPQQYPLLSDTRSHRCHSPSPRSPLRLSPVLHTKQSLGKKSDVACLFCRRRKIACCLSQPGSKGKTCNQCAQRQLKCEYPLECRRGMRKRRSATT
jgi:hypothetical protein